MDVGSKFDPSLWPRGGSRTKMAINKAHRIPASGVIRMPQRHERKALATSPSRT